MNKSTDGVFNNIDWVNNHIFMKNLSQNEEKTIIDFFKNTEILLTTPNFRISTIPFSNKHSYLPIQSIDKVISHIHDKAFSISEFIIEKSEDDWFMIKIKWIPEYRLFKTINQ